MKILSQRSAVKPITLIVKACVKESQRNNFVHKILGTKAVQNKMNQKHVAKHGLLLA